MRLVIDYGNTLVKIAFFDKTSLIEQRVFNKISTERLKLVINEFESNNSEGRVIQRSIISSVTNYPSEIRDFLATHYNHIELNYKTPLPYKIKYDTPETLGNDRIAAVAAACIECPDEDLLVIDAGTCITYDFINSNKEYFGGGISPGINMRFKALNTYTDKLPLVVPGDNVSLIGSSTNDSIQSGVLNGIFAEVDGIIDRYKKSYPSLKIIFTGGDVNYFDKKLKNNIFADLNLVVAGLNYIINYNEGI